VARKSGEVRQKPKTEQSRGESVREEYSMPRGKCTAKRGGSYGGRGGQITWRTGRGYRGGGEGGEGNMLSRGGT